MNTKLLQGAPLAAAIQQKKNLARSICQLMSECCQLVDFLELHNPLGPPHFFGAMLPTCCFATGCFTTVTSCFATPAFTAGGGVFAGAGYAGL